MSLSSNGKSDASAQGRCTDKAKRTELETMVRSEVFKLAAVLNVRTLLRNGQRDESNIG